MIIYLVRGETRAGNLKLRPCEPFKRDDERPLPLTYRTIYKHNYNLHHINGERAYYWGERHWSREQAALAFPELTT